MAGLDPLILCNRACARVGLDPFQTLDDDLPGGQSAGLVYAGLIDFLLGLYPWSWARTTRRLSRLTNVHAFAGFSYVFQLPGDRLNPPEKITTSPADPDAVVTNFVLEDDRLHANEPDLYARIAYAVPPSRWSSSFVEAATLALGAELIMAIAANEKKRDALRKDVYGSAQEQMRGGLIGVAIQADAYGSPSRRLRTERNPLTRHFLGG